MKRLARVGLLLILLSLSSCWGCEHTPPTTTKSPVKSTVYDVSWHALVRDYDSARSYANYRVRIRLEPSDYRIEAGEIHVYAATNNTPPIIVCTDCDKLQPNSSLPLTVIGTCRAPVRDGIWRDRDADFYVTVDDCIVTGR